MILGMYIICKNIYLFFWHQIRSKKLRENMYLNFLTLYRGVFMITKESKKMNPQEKQLKNYTIILLLLLLLFKKNSLSQLSNIDKRRKIVRCRSAHTGALNGWKVWKKGEDALVGSERNAVLASSSLRSSGSTCHDSPAPPQNFAGLQRLKYRSSAEYIGP